MIRKIAITVLMAAASWMSFLWIDSHIRPSRHSLLEITQQLSMQSGNHWEVQWGMTVFGNGQRRIAVVIESQYTLSAGEKPKRLRPINIPGLSLANVGGVADGPPPIQIENTYVLSTPAWLVVVALWTYPIYCFIRGPLRRSRLRRRGLCVKCGYNLTGAPEPRCPECGTNVMLLPSQLPQRSNGP